jgi:hypothetical protein
MLKEQLKLAEQKAREAAGHLRIASNHAGEREWLVRALSRLAVLLAELVEGEEGEGRKCK